MRAMLFLRQRIHGPGDRDWHFRAEAREQEAVRGNGKMQNLGFGTKGGKPGLRWGATRQG